MKAVKLISKFLLTVIGSVVGLFLLALISLHIAKYFMYSDYCVKLEVRTSESETSNNWLLPVTGTLPQLLNRSNALTNKPVIFFISIPYY